MHFPRVAILLLLSVPASAQAGRPSGSVQPEGTITGFVLDPQDQIVEHATVCTTTLSKGTSISMGTSMSTCHTLTDRNGRFTIEHLPMDSYSVSAAKEEDGYSMIGQMPRQKAILTADRPNAQLTVRLGPRSGTLIGTVREKSTGKLIGPFAKLSVQYVLVDGNGTGAISGVDGTNLRVNLPAGPELIVFVSGPGYKPWFYINDQSRPTLRLEPGEEKAIDAELEPRNNQSQ
jgi:Carboxypeptidase regulatory-like domain